MSEDVKPFPPGKSLSALGINVKAPKIGSELTLALPSKNLSTGIQEGLGVRFGMAPLSNHSTQETPQSGYIGGLAYAEEGTAATPTVYTDRRKVFSTVPIVLGDFSVSGLPTLQQAFAWLISKKIDTTYDFVDLVAGVVEDSSSGGFTGTTYQPDSQLAAGISPSSTDGSPTDIDRLFFLSPTYLQADWRVFVQNRFKQPTTTAYINSAIITVSGTTNPMGWFRGIKSITGSATVPCTALYFFTTTGIPTSWSNRLFPNSVRTISIIDVDQTNGLQYQYIYNNITVESSNFYGEGHYATPTFSASIPGGLPAASSIVTRLDGAGSSAASVDYQLINDSDMAVVSNYSLVCAAGGANPIAFFSTPWIRSKPTRPFTAVDLTHAALYPNSINTLSDAGGGALYTENGTPRQTCFAYWPAYTTGTPLQTNAAAAQTGTIHVSLGAANSGLLRANTDYEFTFSIFNKLTNYETNVGSPVRFRTDSDEFVALSIYRDPTSTGVPGGTFRQREPKSLTQFPITDTFGSTNALPANFLQFRFYYRVFGNGEWLPALIVDAAQLFYYPNLAVLWACTGPIAGLPGGQPGGFNDYSALPQDKYIDCVEFQERIFWLTKQSLCWSYRRQPFAYAGRNSSAARTGIFRGLKVHVNKGQRIENNSSRLLICGSEAIYVGRFTGEPILQPIEISPGSPQEFPLEGSDFLPEFWTSFTAYSARTMVIGDGNLYYWGPNGVFFDEGLGDPDRISMKLEPDLFTIVDDTKTDQIFGVFCDGTQEVYWFYPPRNGDGTTTGVLSYNINTGEFQYGDIKGQVDAGQPIQVVKESINWKNISGSRTLLMVRADDTKKIQRAYYFDQRCLGGDMRPFADTLGYSATLISGNDWRFKLVVGSLDNTNFATIVAGDYVAFLQFAAYTRSYVSNTADFIGLVIATGNDGTRNYIDVRLPAAITLNGSSPVTFPSTRCPPIWHASAAGAGLNGFQWILEINFWAPAGVDFQAFWKWVHMIFNVTLIESRKPITYLLSSETPERALPDPIEYLFEDNFSDHYQAYVPLVLSDGMVPQSQAVKLTLTGYQIGSSWVLQYLAVHGAPDKLQDFLKEFFATRA